MSALRRHLETVHHIHLDDPRFGGPVTDAAAYDAAHDADHERLGWAHRHDRNGPLT